MSRHGKDPSEKKDPSKSDSSSDELAEQELQLLSIEAGTLDSPQESPNPGPSVSKGDPLSKPAAGPSGLQESSLKSADLETKSHELGARPKEPTAGPSGFQESRLASADGENKNRELGARPKEPTAGPSGFQESRLASAGRETQNRDLGARPKEKKKHSSRIDLTPTFYPNFPPGDSSPIISQNVPQSMSEGESESQSSEPGITHYIPSDSENAESTSPNVCQSSTGISPPYLREGAVGGVVADLRRACLLPPIGPGERLGYQSYSQGPQSRRAAFANERQSTSSDVSEIQSEMGDVSSEAGDFPEEYSITIGGQSTEASDTSDSASTFGKTTSETIGERLTQTFPADVTRRDSGSGIKSEPSPSKEEREKLRESKQTDKATAEMRKRRAEDEAAMMVTSQSCPDLQSRPRCHVMERSSSVGMQRGESNTSEGASTSRRGESDTSEGASTSRRGESDTSEGASTSRRSESDTSDSRSTFVKTISESMDERLTQSYPGDASRRDSGSGIVSEPSPSKEEREKLRESKQTDKATAEMRKRRAEDEEAMMVTSQSCPDLQSRPQCSVLGRSYSVGMQRGESDTSEGASTSRREESDTNEGASTSRRGESDTSDSTSISFVKTISESMDERLTQSYPGDASRRDSGSGIVSEPSLSNREREKLRESKKTEKATAEMLRQRAEDEKARMVSSQSCPNLPSRSKCPEPKRSCSVGMEHRESSEIEISSETETSKSQGARKSWQRKGLLKRLRHSTVSSGDSFASEEAHSSPSRLQDASVEAQDPVPENMETSPEKSGESEVEIVDNETGETLRVGQSTEESKQTVRKNKRGTRPRSSSQSDDGPDSSPKAETSRPKKKSKQDEESESQDTRSASSDDSSSSTSDDTLTGNEHEGRTKL